jgi:hypothetical protein
MTRFFSDSSEGIKSQVWIALFANLIFSVIHRQIKEVEMFVTLVSMASNNMGSYTCLITLIQKRPPSGDERNIEIVQTDLFKQQMGGVFHKKEKPP